MKPQKQSESTPNARITTATRAKAKTTMKARQGKLGALASPRHSPSQSSKLPPQPRPGLRCWLGFRRLRFLDSRHRIPRPPSRSTATDIAPLTPLVRHAIPDPQVSAGGVIQISSATHVMQSASALLHSAELLEEFAPTDDSFFSALEAVGTVEGGGVGCCCVSVRC